VSNFFKHIDIPQLTNTNRLYHSQISSIQEKATKTYSKLQKALPVFKILIAYSQIVSNFSFVFDMEFPPMFTSLMSIMEPISNLDFVNFVPLDCIFRSNFDQKMLAQVYLPVIIGFLMLTAYSQLKKRGTSEEEKASPEYRQRASFRNWIFGTFLLGTFAVLPSATLKISSTFACREFDVDSEDESWWLKADYSINCSSSSHKLYQVFAILAAFIYPIGIPTFYAWKLIAAKSKLDPGVGQKKLVNTKAIRYVEEEKEGVDSKLKAQYGYVLGRTATSKEEGTGSVNLRLALQKLKAEGKKPELIRLDEGMAMEISVWLREDIESTTPSVKSLSFLYSSYEPRCWWFEIFETIRRLTLTAGVTFMDEKTGANILFSIIICLISMRIYSGFKPFLEDKTDRLAEMMQWQLLFTMLAALALKVNLAGESQQDKKYFDVMLVLLQFGAASFVLVGTMQDKFKELKEARGFPQHSGIKIRERVSKCLGRCCGKRERHDVEESDIDIEMPRLDKDTQDLTRCRALQVRKTESDSGVALGGEVISMSKLKEKTKTTLATVTTTWTQETDVRGVVFFRNNVTGESSRQLPHGHTVTTKDAERAEQDSLDNDNEESGGQPRTQLRKERSQSKKTKKNRKDSKDHLQTAIDRQNML